mgnify:CR=1 FL=1
MNRLEKTAQLALFDYLELEPKQALLIVAARDQAPVANLFRKVAEKAKSDVFILELPGNHDRRTLHSLFSRNFINTAEKVLVLAPRLDTASINWLRQQTRSRVVICPVMEEEAVQRSAKTDLRRLRERCRKIADILTIGKTIKVTSKAGAALEMSIHQHRGALEATPLQSGLMCTSMPTGRAYIAPISNTVNGELILNGVAGERNSSSAIITIKVMDGKIKMIRGGKEAMALRRRLRTSGAELVDGSVVKSKTGTARTVLEIGFGMNEFARLGQSELEDEKTLGTIHLGFGRRLGSAKLTEIVARGLITEPTVSIDSRTIMQDGKLMFE